ncbi:hypothetical protein [Nostoc piscinale]|uniref:hypothetical protein n=1 Tax=Nostoc piscinale TaxID=224012 RepID=UPI0011876F6C|nr:hypothetical protein [Nostoc piscinale]
MLTKNFLTLFGDRTSGTNFIMFGANRRSQRSPNALKTSIATLSAVNPKRLLSALFNYLYWQRI